MNLNTKHNKIASYVAAAGIGLVNVAVVLAFVGLMQDVYRVDLRFSSTSPMVQLDFVVRDSSSQLSLGRLLLYIESFFKTPHSGQVCRENLDDKARRIG